MIIPMREYRALIRTDFQVFFEKVFATLNPNTLYSNPTLILKITSALERVRRGECRRLIINMPPRNGKSTLASVAFPAWLLAQNPALRLINVSYSQELADALARDCLRIMRERWYCRAFPGTRLSRTRQATHDFKTTAGGGRLSTSVGGTLTGLGADVIVIDDPVKPDQAMSDVERNAANEWYRNTLVSRLNNKATGAIVLVMQRLHEDDMVGFVQDLDDWEVISIPAIAQEDGTHLMETPYGNFTYRQAMGDVLDPVREPRDVLRRMERQLGPENFAAQYLQSPTPPGGGMIKTSWFPRFDPKNPPKFDRVFQSWDTASKPGELADYSVCTTWGAAGAHVYLLHVFRERVGFPELREAVLMLAKLHRPEVILIEDRSSGTQLIQDLRASRLYPVVPYAPKGDKVMRLHAQTAFMRHGGVHLPDEAPWLEDLLHEYAMFPNGRYDDQVDSTAQALHWLFDDGLLPPGLLLMREWAEFQTSQDRPKAYVRVHHAEGRTFSTVQGRLVTADQDGIFLITADEWVPSLLQHGYRLLD